MFKLADRYREMMVLRREALNHYRANEMSSLSGPPARAYLPHIAPRDDANGRFAFGNFGISDRPPIWHFAENALATAPRRANILEIGPGGGALARHLQAKFGSHIGSYLALERDETFTGPYERVAHLDDIRSSIDLVIASEVAEHMTADDWYANFLRPLRRCASRNATLVMSVPNPSTPVGIARDFTHVQAYPWYDLYALLRLEFQNVRIHRAYYVWSLQRLAFLVPRLVLCPLLEFDWCDTLVAVASLPTAGEAE